MNIARRGFLAGAAAVPLAGIPAGRARAAEFTFKLANNTPATHPQSIRQTEAAARIRSATGGRLDIQVFPDSQLGSDTDTLSQLRSGAVEMVSVSGLILSTLVPQASISGVGFAFKDYATVWAAMDGALGAYVRGRIRERGLVAMDRIWDNGFRQITSSSHPVTTPADLSGFKIRVPVSPLSTSTFEALGASPASINLSEVYSALQTKVVEGQENPLSLIALAKFYEVQTYCALTGHMWDGFWLLANQRAWSSLPEDVRAIAARELNRSALDERADLARFDDGVMTDLKARGLVFNDVDRAAFRAKLKEAGFYAQWKKRYGDAAWSVLEGAVGTLT